MEALSLATSIIQFIDFTSSLIGKGIEIHASATGRSADHDDLEKITDSLVHCSSELGQSEKTKKASSATERSLQRIAADCQDIAEELLVVLARLKSGGQRSKWATFRKLLQSSWHEGKIQTLETRLDRFRQQMVIIVLNSLRNQSNQSIKEQISIRESVERIEEIQKNSMSFGDRFIKQLMDSEQWKRNVIQAIHEQEPGEIRGIHLASISDRDGHTPPAIEAQNNRIQKRILHKLAFRNMSDRERRISKAHDRTYEWIFSDLDHGPLPTSSSFKSFLQRADEKIYWITGKPGSGKSTLMKFIRQRTETTDILRDWTGGDDIIQAAFYFWNSGTRMQMTVEGLLQTILHECLEKLKWAIQDVLPERWEVATLFSVDDFPWTLEEIAQALQRLISEVCSDKKFFLLIDGLDECSGDQTRLIELISELAQESGNLKICVASRPWTNFEDAFRGRPSLRLQDLTQDDIKHYIQSKFNANTVFTEFRVRDPTESDKLLRNISTKAEGVFLWVQLVVQSLLEGLTNGDRARDLQRRLDQLPRRLEHLYANILEHLDIHYLEHASQLFQIVRACDDSPTLLCVAFADLDDGQRALKAPVRPLSHTETSSLCKNMRRKLTSRCLGLLDISSSNDKPKSDLLDVSSIDNELNIDREGEENLDVQYLHRSVRDYIEDPEVWNWLVSANKDPFDPHLALFKANLLRLKHNNPGLATSRFFLRTLTAIKYALRSLQAHDYGIRGKEKEVIQLLDELDKACISLTTPDSHSGQVFGDRCGTLQGEHWSSFLIMRTEKPSFMHLMAICGVSKYLERRLRRFEDSFDDVEDCSTPLILTALDGDLAVPDTHTYPHFTRPSIEVLRVVLNKGGSCHRKWRGTSAWMLAAKWKQTRVLELFRKHGGKPPEPLNSLRPQHGSQYREGSRETRSSSEREDGSDAESTTSTDARHGLEPLDDTPRWRDSDSFLTQNRVRRGPPVGPARPHRSHRLTLRTNNDRRNRYQEYPEPQYHLPRPAYSHTQPAFPQPPPVRERVYFHAPPPRLQQWHNPFTQPPFGYQPYHGYSYGSGPECYPLPSRPDQYHTSWYYNAVDERGFLM